MSACGKRAGRSGCLSSPQGKWGETLWDPSASPSAFAWPCDSCRRDLGTDALGIRLTREGCLQNFPEKSLKIPSPVPPHQPPVEKAGF